MLLKELNLYQFRTRRQFIGEIYRLVERARYEAKWKELSQTLEAEIKRYQYLSPYSEVSISLLDLQTDAQISLGGDIPREPGCVINQFVLYSIVQDFQRNLYEYQPLARSIYLAVGESKAAVAEGLLRDYIGGGEVEAGVKRINQMIRGLGLTTTFFDHPPAFTYESLEGRPNLMTTDEAVDVMSKLYRNQIFKEQTWTDFAIQRLVEGKPGLNYMIGIGVRNEPNVRVAHKIGYFSDPDDSWRDVECDAGLVLIDAPGTQRGEIAYAIAIFSKGNRHSPPDKPSILYDGWFASHVSQAVYDFFKEQYL